MKPREILAVVIALAALVGGMWFMFNAETSVISNAYQEYLAAGEDRAVLDSMIRGLKAYSWAIGLALVGASIAYILLGHENDLITTADEEGKK